MPIVVEKSVEIMAPPEKVWELVSNLKNLPQWMPLRSVRTTSAHEEGLGVTCVCETQDKRMGGTINEEVIEWREGVKVSRRVTGTPTKSMVETNIVTPLQNGTQFTLRAEMELAGFKRLFGSIIKRTFDKNMEIAVMKLKAKLEE